MTSESSTPGATLVERDNVLRDLLALLAMAQRSDHGPGHATGHRWSGGPRAGSPEHPPGAPPTLGHVALIAGEAGVGKTSVLRALAAVHADRGGVVWWGGCDDLETPHPLAPLRDIAQSVSPRFARHLEAARSSLFAAVLDELRGTPVPVLMVIEDAHWADDATLDLLKYLGRRIDGARALLAVSYRDDEVGLSHPLRRVLGELPLAWRHRFEIARLSPEGVAVLARRCGRSAAGVYAVTRGNPLFVTELLRDTSQPPARVPRSVQDVVLARFVRLPPRVQALLQAVAVVPGRIEAGLLTALVAPTRDDLATALDSGLLVYDGTRLAFRHELARVAIETALPAPVALDLHRRVLAALSAAPLVAGSSAPVPEGMASAVPVSMVAGVSVGPNGSDPVAPRETALAARLVHHAVLAQDGAALARHAPAAARDALAHGALREAAAYWTLAVRQAVPADTPDDRALLEQHALACAAVGRAEDAMSSRVTLERLARARGDHVGAALELIAQAELHTGKLRYAQAEVLTRQALELLPVTPAGRAHVKVWRWAAHLRMLARDGALAAQLAGRAADLAGALGDAVAMTDARATQGTALLFVDFGRGVEILEAARERYRAAGQPLGEVQVLCNLGSGAGELQHWTRARAWLEAGLTLALAHEFDGYADYLRAWLAHVALQQGHWDAAGQWADEVLQRTGVAAMSRLTALVAVARLRLRRGDPGAAEVLDEALQLTGPDNFLQRSAPLRAVRAEAALLRGDRAAAQAEVRAVLPLALDKAHPWLVGELACWGARAGLTDLPVAACAPPHALELTGRWQEAADAWAQLGCPYEQAGALEQGDAAARQQALVLYESLGARPAAEALRRAMRATGVVPVVPGRRAATRRHPAGLTATEMRVLTLLAAGHRNAAIAAALHRSVRTIDHHVAAVLAKLGVRSRQAAIEHARRAGWLTDTAPAPK